MEGKGDRKAGTRVEEGSINLMFVAFIGVAVGSAEKP
jgi:hypothetical protein